MDTVNAPVVEFSENAPPVFPETIVNVFVWFASGSVATTVPITVPLGTFSFTVNVWFPITGGWLRPFRLTVAEVFNTGVPLSVTVIVIDQEVATLALIAAAFATLTWQMGHPGVVPAIVVIFQ